jgi:hypothetical protein
MQPIGFKRLSAKVLSLCVGEPKVSAIQLCGDNQNSYYSNGDGAHLNGLKHVCEPQLATEWKCVAAACHTVSVGEAGEQQVLPYTTEINNENTCNPDYR